MTSSNNYPNFIYGTAWKKDSTTKLVELAITSGFRAIDTANQLKHYSEKLVGDALFNLSTNGIKREEIWLQSKFTSLSGQQVETPPYNPKADLKTQVRESFESTLLHLRTNYLDSFLLHGPYNHPLLGAEDFQVWSAIEELYSEGKIKSIGVSNMNLFQMRLFLEKSKIKPMTLQNRCFANKGWDKENREFCNANNIHYQGFSLLTANPRVMQNNAIFEMAAKYSVTPAQIVFRFARQIGITPLTGTTNEERMKLDLAISNFELSPDEVAFVLKCS